MESVATLLNEEPGNSRPLSAQPLDRDFDSLLLLACQISATPIAAIAQSNKEYTFFKAAHGFTIRKIRWVLQDENNQLIQVPDTQLDERFTHFPLLTGERPIRMYTAIPLINTEGIQLGQLCIMDEKTGTLTESQIASLQTLATSILSLLAMKSQLQEYKRTDNLAALAAEKLDKQKAFYENILNKLPTDVAVFDAQHRYLFVNPAAISKQEYREFIVGKDDYEYVRYRNRDISVAHARRAKFLEAKNTGAVVRWEDTLSDPNGNLITHLRRMFPVYDADGTLTQVIGFGIDITDRKMMEEKQAAYVKQLSTQNTQLKDFCSIVSHNLRAPLVNMSMLVDFIETTEDEDEKKLLISKLRPVIDNLHATFNELVESIQIRQDPDIQSEALCLHECIKRTMEGLQTEITTLGARLELDFTEGSVIHCPPQYLNSIVHNLVSNSLKYRHPDRPPVITVRTNRINDNMILSVSDNGLGIDLVKHKENFFKIGKVFHRHPNAKGFGLFMTKTHVEAMGGRIWVESEPDNGAIFFVEFVNQKRKLS